MAATPADGLWQVHFRTPRCVALAQGLAPRLQAQIEGKTPYEIQEKCFDYVRHEYRPPDEVETRIKTCAYDHGIKRGQVLDVLAVELRDKLLAMKS